MANFELVFDTEADDDILELFEKEIVDYAFWGILDILIDGQSFFNNFKSYYYDKYYARTSGISNKGITVPIFPMLEAIIKGIVNLSGENVTVVIEEDTGQISKIIVFSKTDDNNIIFAIRQRSFTKYTWYDGEKVSVNKEIPISNFNIVKKEDVIDGCNKSVRKYFLYLIDKYPSLNEIHYFRKLSKRVGL